MERKNKKRIRRVAAASLVLGGGCGGDGSPVAKIAKDLCAALESCFPAEFPMYYASQDACVTEIQTELEMQEANPAYSQECIDAGRTFYECYVTAFAASCDYYQAITMDCATEAMAAGMACQSTP